MSSAWKFSLPRLSFDTEYPRSRLIQLSCLISGSVLVAWKLKTHWSTYRRHRRLYQLIAKRNVERNEVIAKLEAVLENEDKTILEKRKKIVILPTKELIKKLQNEELRPLDVLEAFQYAAIAAHKKTNCVTQFITEAREWCGELERKYKGNQKPPLYGVPFSVKESIGVRGYDSTAGLAQFLYKPLDSDGALVTRLRQLGAIPFVLTNVPQTLLSFGCSNPVYGLTTHPLKEDRTCGGSSGGEGALIALRGSPLGLGSDLAGSIRVPSHFSGVVGLKPSTRRLSALGGRKAIRGRALAQGAYGPMTNDVDMIAVFMEHVLHEEFFSMDCNIVPVPFRRDLYEGEKKLVIGYYDYDGYIEPVPACRRAVQIAKEILERNGHRLVPFTPPGMEKFAALSLKVFSIDGGYGLTRVLSNDVPDAILAPGYRIYSLPIFFRKLQAKMALLRGQKKLGTVAGSIDTTTREFGITNAAVLDFKATFNAEWRRAQLDAVVCPPAATVATQHDIPWQCFPAFYYMAMYNVLDYAAGIVPVTKVTSQDEQQVQATYSDKEHYAKLIKKCNVEGTTGLPVGVQCVASTYNEETCLRVMKEIEDGVRGMK